MSKNGKLLFWSLIVLGSILGFLFIPSSLSGNILISAGYGAVLAFVFSFLVIPELRNRYMEAWTTNGFHLMFSHPTQLPLLLGIVWFIGFIIFISLSNMTITLVQTSLFLFLPCTILFGLSGLMMVIRKEYIRFTFSEFIVIRGKEAILRGILIMIILWGFGIFSTLSAIFHW